MRDFQTTAFQGKQALVIDDDPVSVAVLQKMLDQMHVTSRAISDIYHIDEWLVDIERPDVIFLDLELPGTSGYLILKRLQEHEKLVGVPTVAYTVHTGQMNTGKAAGFHSYLGKPLDSRNFPDQLARIFKGVPVWEVP